MGQAVPPKLSLKQERFVKAYALTGNGAASARMAGYPPKASRQVASENLSKPDVRSAFEREVALVAKDFSPDRVRRRLHELSLGAQGAGQFGPAVRCEELLGKAAGMWIEQSINLQGQLTDSHINALLDIARSRQAQPVELQDIEGHNRGHSDLDRGD